MNESRREAGAAISAQLGEWKSPRHAILIVFLLALLAALVAGYWHSLAFLLGSELRLDLGSINFPTQRLTVAWNAYALWGTVAAVVLFMLLPSGMMASSAAWAERRPRLTIWMFVILNVVTAIAVKVFLLHFMPLTDDESAYRFAAETLRSGQLAIDAPSIGSFLDRAFVIINDRMYVPYFLGWPAFLAVGGLLGLEEATAAIFSGLCVIPLAFILRQFSTTPFVLGGLAVYSASLMVIILGGTLLAHSAAAFFILCFIERSLFIRESTSNGALQGALCALAFCIAFFIRPATALAVGAPFLIALAFSLVTSPRQRGRAAGGFAAIGLLGATLFLLLNKSLYGGYLDTGYSNYHDYIRAIGRNEFGPNNPTPLERVALVLAQPELQWRLLRAAIGRLSHDFLGWPLPFFLVSLIAVIWDRRLWLFVASIAALIAVHALILDFGIDSFGPVHLYEAGPLLIVLWCAAGQGLVKAANSRQAFRFGQRELGRPGPEHFLRATVALCLCAWLFYFPLRADNVAVMVADIAAPLEAAKQLEGRVVVFAPQSRAGIQTGIQPLRHFVFFIPFNDIHLDNRILWMREAPTNEENSALLATMPDRRGYRLRWNAAGEPLMLPMNVTTHRRYDTSSVRSEPALDGNGQFEKRSAYSSFAQGRPTCPACSGV